jgi:HD-GYP domain-containing protein (c-di-GMP phosphodiesterase class II)
MVRSHHERWDGTGYPDGLSGDKIPVTARIVAVAETFDALTFDQTYRKALPADEAFSIIHEGAGTQFDPDCVQAFLRARPGIEQTFRQRRSLTQTMTAMELAAVR